MVESVQHTTVERPWGRYVVMDEGPSFKVKRIVVDPGKKLSLQVHQHRAEHWVVVSGTARVTIGQEIILVGSNQSVYIPQKTPHRLENPTVEPIQLIEVQTGAYLKETISSAWRMTTGARIRFREQGAWHKEADPAQGLLHNLPQYPRRLANCGHGGPA